MCTENGKVHGKSIDDQTRCIHWHSDLDIIAIKFACCNKYYPCFSCHVECETHQPKQWSIHKFKTEKAILCGKCKKELTIYEYFNCNNRCIHCKANFNPGCKKHYHLYFQIDSKL